MPFRIPDAIKKFKFTLSDTGLPIANVILLGGIRYVEVCPLCSCIHELPVRHEGDEYEPRCLWREWQRPDYKLWLEKHPDANKYTRVLLRNVEIAELAKPPLKVVKKRASRKAKAA